jgi:hypothetical protein
MATRQTQKGANRMNGYTTNNETLYFVDYYLNGQDDQIQTKYIWAPDAQAAKNEFLSTIYDDMTSDDWFNFVSVTRPGE